MYDVEEAFALIENELLDSLSRNLKRHIAEETELGFNWSAWQVEQLTALEQYKRTHQRAFTRRYASINAKMLANIQNAYAEGQNEEARRLTDLLKHKRIRKRADGDVNFFALNESKLQALLDAVTSDMQRAEQAILRKYDDQYRRIIFNAQVYSNTTGDYNKAVDMATKSFLAKGIDCVRYKNGRDVNIKSYAGMVLRTSDKRAKLYGEGTTREIWGVHTVISAKRGHGGETACPLCRPFVEKIMIDDVYSGGTAEESLLTGYPTLSSAMAEGFLHPNCKCGVTTYFPELEEGPQPMTKAELKQSAKRYNDEVEKKNIERHIGVYDRLSRYSLDDDNVAKYKAKLKEWRDRYGNSK